MFNELRRVQLMAVFSLCFSLLVARTVFENGNILIFKITFPSTTHISLRMREGAKKGPKLIFIYLQRSNSESNETKSNQNTFRHHFTIQSHAPRWEHPTPHSISPTIFKIIDGHVDPFSLPYCGPFASARKIYIDTEKMRAEEKL